uniref:Uncharacterized protein n=2 Tax=Lutzomyia longipalpis TaxID=7200 RepID=A0A1B0CB95_LUTLO
MEKGGANVAKMVDGRVLLNPTTAGTSQMSQGPSNVATVSFSNHPRHHSSYPEKGYRGNHAHHGSGVVNPGYVGSSTTIRSESTPSVQ